MTDTDFSGLYARISMSRISEMFSEPYDPPHYYDEALSYIRPIIEKTNSKTDH